MVLLGQVLAVADGLDNNTRILEHRRPCQVAERRVCRQRAKARPGHAELSRGGAAAALGHDERA